MMTAGRPSDAGATRVAFPGLDGILPGYGRQKPNDWGLGVELRDAFFAALHEDFNTAAALHNFGSPINQNHRVAYDVYTRVDADYADPLDLRPDSRLGVVGLVEVLRRGASGQWTNVSWRGAIRSIVCNDVSASEQEWTWLPSPYCLLPRSTFSTWTGPAPSRCTSRSRQDWSS